MPLLIRHLSAAELLSHPIPFRMARYQRHYEWGRKEMEQLLEDLTEMFELHSQDPAADAYHFLGNVILYPSPAGYIEVVDGQQRLTSISAILAAARDLAQDGSVEAELGRLLRVGGRPRLELHRGDNAFLSDHILAPGATARLEDLPKQTFPGAECLRVNTLLARLWLQEMAHDTRTAFIRFALEQGRFVEIQVGTEDDAFRIFETVNSRGRPIASEDVLRYALVELATDDPVKRDEFLERWDAVEAELGPRGMKRFVAGWRARASKGSRLRQSLHRTVMSTFKTREDAYNFLNEQLGMDVSIYRQISNADIEIDDGPDKRRIDTLLRSLALLDFDDWVPIACVLLDSGKGQAKRIAADLARIERLAWFYYLIRDGKGAYQERRERFGELLRKVTEAGTFESLPPRSLLSEEQCTKMVECILGRIDPKWVPLRSLLVRLEMALAGDGAVFVREDLTIEHILPLRPSTLAWKSMFGEDPSRIADYAEQIGNLCLVSSELNNKLGNQIYKNKRRLMVQHNIPSISPLAADIGKETQWTREVIKRRSEMLIGLFCKIFELPMPKL